MTPILIVSLYYGDGSLLPMVLSILITTACGTILLLASRGATVEYISIREGLAIVSFGWIAIGLFGALPFYFGIESCSYTDAFFESTSGFTTTGASIFQDVESISKSLLLWRSLIQWLGGMGIIVLSLAVLPFLKVGGMQLYRAEVPSPAPDKLKPGSKRPP